MTSEPKAVTSRHPLPVIHLKPARGWVSLNLAELWQYRELIYFLTWRDIKVRYKQAALGILWVVIQAVLTMVVFTVIFGGLFKLPTDNNIPTPLFILAAQLPWHLFSGALSRSGTSLVGNANLLTKVYFPRLAIPLSAVLAGLVDFGVSLLVLLGMMLYYGTPFSWKIFWIFPLALLALLTALSVGLWLSALNVQYRDVQQMIPFLVNIWMYASPVGYSASLITSPTWKLIYSLNPLAGIIQGFRWALLGANPPDVTLLISSAVVVVLFISGLFYFRRMEKTFADMV